MDIEVIIEDTANKIHPLDMEDCQCRFRKIQSWREHAREMQRDSRVLQMRDCDFYDGDQHDEEDIKTLR